MEQLTLAAKEGNFSRKKDYCVAPFWHCRQVKLGQGHQNDINR